MNELDEMHKAPRDTILPEFVRFCKNRLKAGDRIELELYRPDSVAGPTLLAIHRYDEKDDYQQSRQTEWDDGVNAGLVALGIRSVNLEQEAQRFALALRSALRKVERKYGDGYLNAVLLDLLNESELGKNGELAEMLKNVHTSRPEHTRAYPECRELIADEIRGRAVELRDKLKYKAEEVKTVMTKALAIYLDQRFSISSRLNFGL